MFIQQIPTLTLLVLDLTALDQVAAVFNSTTGDLVDAGIVQRSIMGTLTLPGLAHPFCCSGFFCTLGGELLLHLSKLYALRLPNPLRVRCDIGFEGRTMDVYCQLGTLSALYSGSGAVGKWSGYGSLRCNMCRGWLLGVERSVC